MSSFNDLSIVKAIFEITVKPTSNAVAQGVDKVRLATGAEGGGGGVNIGAIIGAIAGVVLILAAILIIFLKSRNRNRKQYQSRSTQSNYPTHKQSLFTLGSYKQPPQALPLYTQPTSPYAQHYNGGVSMPQAVHPSTSGYYRQAGQVQQDNGVRFGGVGVVRY